MTEMTKEVENMLREFAEALGRLLDSSIQLDSFKGEYHYRRYLSCMSSAYSELAELIPNFLEEEKKERG